nr:poly-beta-1,6-N-acetyl-D-glucosamine biosynthesis protein PgaD [uncultured Albidiferax sp.]
MKSPLIIDRPDLQAWQQKAMFGAITAAFWLAWVILWLPLITLLGWLFFGQRFQLQMIDLNGYKAFMNLLSVYCVVVGVMGGSLILWATYNHLRFRGIDRRRETDVPSDTAMGELINHPSTAINTWRNHAIVTVHHDEHGGIQNVVPTLLQNPLTPPAGSKRPTQSLA